MGTPSIETAKCFPLDLNGKTWKNKLQKGKRPDKVHEINLIAALCPLFALRFMQVAFKILMQNSHEEEIRLAKNMDETKTSKAVQ